MPNFEAYPTVKDTPSRKQRKAKRGTIFQANKAAFRLARKERRKLKEGTENA